MTTMDLEPSSGSFYNSIGVSALKIFSDDGHIMRKRPDIISSCFLILFVLNVDLI